MLGWKSSGGRVTPTPTAPPGGASGAETVMVVGCYGVELWQSSWPDSMGFFKKKKFFN